MDTEEQLCNRYGAAFGAIAALDRRYYLNPAPTLANRAAYAARQAQLEYLRSRFYGALAELRQFKQFRRCRSVIRGFRRQDWR